MRKRASVKDAASSYLQKTPALRAVGMLEKFVEDERNTTLAAIERPTGKAGVVFEGRETKAAAIGYDESPSAKEKREKLGEYCNAKNGTLEEVAQKTGDVSRR